MRIFLNFRSEITSYAVVDRFRSLLLANNAFDQIVVSPDKQAPIADYAMEAVAAIAGCDAFVALIAPGWAELRDDHGLRIDNPLDPVRTEIVAALDRIIPMVPVLLDGATFPDPTEIASALQGLTLREPVELKLTSLETDFPRLLAALLPDVAEDSAKARQPVQAVKPATSRPGRHQSRADPMASKGASAAKPPILSRWRKPQPIQPKTIAASPEENPVDAKALPIISSADSPQTPIVCAATPAEMARPLSANPNKWRLFKPRAHPISRSEQSTIQEIETKPGSADEILKPALGVSSKSPPDQSTRSPDVTPVKSAPTDKILTFPLAHKRLIIDDKAEKNNQSPGPIVETGENARGARSALVLLGIVALIGLAGWVFVDFMEQQLAMLRH